MGEQELWVHWNMLEHDTLLVGSSREMERKGNPVSLTLVTTLNKKMVQVLNSRSTDLHILCNLVLLKIKTFPE